MMYKVSKGNDIEYTTPHILFIGDGQSQYKMLLDSGYTVSYIGSYAKHIYFDGTILEKCYYKRNRHNKHTLVCILC